MLTSIIVLLLCLGAGPVLSEVTIHPERRFPSGVYSPHPDDGFETLLAPPVTVADTCRLGALRFVIRRWREPQQSAVAQAFGSVEGVLTEMSPPELEGLQMGGCSGRFQKDLLVCAKVIYAEVPPDLPIKGSFGGEAAFAAHLTECLSLIAKSGVEPLSKRPAPAVAP